MHADLPTGVVTLLFTDIEGSTRLLADLRTDYVEALAHHRETIRSACHRHDGVIVDSQGDSMLLAFGRPADATATAARAQRDLATGPVRVRMGIHSGTPQLRDGAYVGMDVHRGARIASAGHGGQVLLSEATQVLVEDDVSDLGRHWLKDLDEPEHIYQLAVDGQPSTFAPLRTIEADRPRLPAWATSFIGRDHELSRIGQLLEKPSHRIVTLVGPGGAGKTRLALEAASRYWDHKRRHTVFAPLVTVTTEDQLVASLADAFGFAIDLAHGAGRSPEDQLIDFLRPRSTLIVADNFEQLLSAGGLLSRIAEGAPEVTFLVTSRARLELAGEWPVEVEGLDATHDVDAAVRLFVERARQRDPNLVIDDAEWPAIGRICRLTEAMPLAIELAAAWMGIITPAELADELERDLDILASRSGDTPHRHRSLRAAFDSSWRLLDDEQRRILAGLSVFRGVFSREGAADVVGARLPGLAELASRSLIRRVGERYELHDLIHRYAAEELDRSGLATNLREAHARAFVKRLASRSSRLRSADGPDTLAELHPDLPDLRAAAAWAVTHWNSDEVEPLLQGLTNIWALQVDPSGPATFRELARCVEEDRDPALDEGAAVPMVTKLAPHLAVSLASVDANVESDAVVDEHLASVRETGDEWAIAACLLARGMNQNNRDENTESVPPLEEADALLAQVGDDILRSDVLTWLGWAHLMRDEVIAARRDFEEARRAAIRSGEPVIIAFADSKLGTIDDAEDRPAEALQRHLDAFASFDAAGNSGGVGYSLSRASLSAYSLGDFGSALDFGQIAYEAFSKLGHRWGRSIAMARVAFAYLGQDRPVEARRWALDSLRLGRDDVRLGRLYALSAVAAAGIRSGDAIEWLPVLRATVADPDFPAVYSVQARKELAIAEDGAGSGAPSQADDAGFPDLDAIIANLAGAPSPS